MEKFKTIASGIYVLLFFAGFAGGYASPEMMDNVLAERERLIAGAGLFAFAASFFTPFFIVRSIHQGGLPGYLKNAGVHFLLNISVFGANGLFCFLLYNASAEAVCKPQTYAVLEHHNIEEKRRHITLRYSLVATEIEGVAHTIRFDSTIETKPGRIELCIDRGRLGFDVIRSKRLLPLLKASDTATRLFRRPSASLHPPGL